MVISKGRIKFTLCSRWAFPYHQGGIPMHNYFLLELLKDGMDIALISSQNEQNVSYYSKKYIFNICKMISSINQFTSISMKY